MLSPAYCSRLSNDSILIDLHRVNASFLLPLLFILCNTYVKLNSRGLSHHWPTRSLLCICLKISVYLKESILWMFLDGKNVGVKFFFLKCKFTFAIDCSIDFNPV